MESLLAIQLFIAEYKNTVELFTGLWKKRNNSINDSWRMDETYIKVKGQWYYLYRAIDSSGLTLDIWLRKNRDKQAA